MRNKVPKFVVVVLLIVTFGGHWFFLQSVAWVSMFTEFSQSSSVTQALVETFNGENPCGLCLAIQRGKQAEQEQETVKVEAKLDLFLSAGNALSLCRDLRDMEPIPPLSALALARFERPPSPPPRSV